MAGAFDRELMAASEAVVLWTSLKRFAKFHVYRHRSVLEVELDGHRTVHELMDMFWKAIIERKDPDDLRSDREALPAYVYSRISENYRRVAESPGTRCRCATARTAARHRHDLGYDRHVRGVPARRPEAAPWLTLAPPSATALSCAGGCRRSWRTRLAGAPRSRI